VRPSELDADKSSSRPLLLRKQPAHQRRVRHSSHHQAIRPGPHVRPMFPRTLMHFLKRALHHCFQLRIHFRFGPEEALQILHPFELAHNRTSRTQYPGRRCQSAHGESWTRAGRPTRQATSQGPRRRSPSRSYLRRVPTASQSCLGRLVRRIQLAAIVSLRAGLVFLRSCRLAVRRVCRRVVSTAAKRCIAKSRAGSVTAK
jgi:hypothetical protein